MGLMGVLAGEGQYLQLLDDLLQVAPEYMHAGIKALGGYFRESVQMAHDAGFGHGWREGAALVESVREQGRVALLDVARETGAAIAHLEATYNGAAVGNAPDAVAVAEAALSRLADDIEAGTIRPS